MLNDTPIPLNDFEQKWPEIKLVLEWSDRGGLLFLYGAADAEAEMRKRISEVVGHPYIIKAMGNNIEDKAAHISSQLLDNLSSETRNIWLDMTTEKKDVCRRTLAIMNRARSHCENSKKFYTLFLPVECIREAITYAPDAISVALMNCPIAEPKPDKPKMENGPQLKP